MRHRGCASWGKASSTLSLLLLTAFLWCGCETPRSSTTNTLHATHLQLGLCEDYPKESRTINKARRDLLLLKTNGIHYLRMAFAWEAMEPQPGKFDWSFWDDYVRIANELVKVVLGGLAWNLSFLDKLRHRQPAQLPRNLVTRSC